MQNFKPKAVRWVIVRRESGPGFIFVWYYNSSGNVWRLGKPRLATEYKSEAAAERIAFKVMVSNPTLMGRLFVKKRMRDFTR